MAKKSVIFCWTSFYEVVSENEDFNAIKDTKAFARIKDSAISDQVKYLTDYALDNSLNVFISIHDLFLDELDVKNALDTIINLIEKSSESMALIVPTEYSVFRDITYFNRINELCKKGKLELHLVDKKMIINQDEIYFRNFGIAIKDVKFKFSSLQPIN